MSNFGCRIRIRIRITENPQKTPPHFQLLPTTCILSHVQHPHQHAQSQIYMLAIAQGE